MVKTRIPKSTLTLTTAILMLNKQKQQVFLTEEELFLDECIKDSKNDIRKIDSNDVGAFKFK